MQVELGKDEEDEEEERARRLQHHGRQSHPEVESCVLESGNVSKAIDNTVQSEAEHPHYPEYDDICDDDADTTLLDFHPDDETDERDADKADDSDEELVVKRFRLHPDDETDERDAYKADDSDEELVVKHFRLHPDDSAAAAALTGDGACTDGGAGNTEAEEELISHRLCLRPDNATNLVENPCSATEDNNDVEEVHLWQDGASSLQRHGDIGHNLQSQRQNSSAMESSPSREQSEDKRRKFIN